MWEEKTERRWGGPLETQRLVEAEGEGDGERGGVGDPECKGFMITVPKRHGVPSQFKTRGRDGSRRKRTSTL